MYRYIGRTSSSGLTLRTFGIAWMAHVVCRLLRAPMLRAVHCMVCVASRLLHRMPGIASSGGCIGSLCTISRAARSLRCTACAFPGACSAMSHALSDLMAAAVKRESTALGAQWRVL